MRFGNQNTETWRNGMLKLETMLQETQAILLSNKAQVLYHLGFNIRRSTYLISFNYFTNCVNYVWHSAAKAQDGEKQDHCHNFLLRNSQQQPKGQVELQGRKVHSLTAAPGSSPTPTQHMASSCRMTRVKSRRWLLKAPGTTLVGFRSRWGKEAGMTLGTSLRNTALYDAVAEGWCSRKGKEGVPLGSGPESQPSHEKYPQWRSRPESSSHSHRPPRSGRGKWNSARGYWWGCRRLLPRWHCWRRLLPGILGSNDKEEHLDSVPHLPQCSVNLPAFQGWIHPINSALMQSEKKVKSFSRVRLLATPWTVAYQAPPSRGFSRQEHWSGLPFPSPGDIPALQQVLYHLSHQGSPFIQNADYKGTCRKCACVMRTSSGPPETACRKSHVNAHTAVAAVSHWAVPTSLRPHGLQPQAPLPFTVSQSVLRLMSTESNHLVLCCRLLLLPSILPSTRVLFKEWTLHIRWPELQLQHQSFQGITQGWFPLGWTGLISELSSGLSRVFPNSTV